MRVLDRFHCKLCHKEVILEVPDDSPIDMDGHDVKYTCSDCYDKFILPILFGEYKWICTEDSLRMENLNKPTDWESYND